MRAFDFEIKTVDQFNGLMYVEYTTEGHDAIQVGVRLPLEGEDEDTVIALAAPHSAWEMREFLAAPKQLPTVGRKGRVEPVEAVAQQVAQPAPEFVVKKRTVL